MMHCQEEQGIYTARWDDPAVVMQFDRLRWDRYGALSAEATVWLTEPTESKIHSAQATLTTTDGRKKLADHCGKRAPEISADWLAMTDAACIVVRDAFRRGEPAIQAGDAPDIEPGAAQIRDMVTGDVLLPHNELTILFGDGDAGKSTTALLLGALIHTGRSDIASLEVEQTRVAYADWETSPGVQKLNLRRIFGEFYPKDLLLIPGAGIPLPDSVDRLRNFIREHRIGYLIVDSIGYACGGPPEDASVAAGFLNALQQLGLSKSLGVLAIAHVNRADARGQAEKPFGSAFWHNSARMSWYAKRNEGSQERYTLGLFNKKANLGPRSRAIGLTLDYGSGGLAFGRSDVVADPDLSREVSHGVLITRLLARTNQPMTYADIGLKLDIDKDTIRTDCNRLMSTGQVVKVPSEGRTVRVALRQVEAA